MAATSEAHHGESDDGDEGKDTKGGSDPDGEEGGIGVEGSVEMDVGRVLEAGDADLTGVHDPCVE